MKGKFKEDFDKWIMLYLEENGHITNECSYYEDFERYFKLPIEMQFGVIQCFADSVDIEIIVERFGNVFEVKMYKHTLEILDVPILFEINYVTRQEAMAEAVKYFEIYYNEI